MIPGDYGLPHSEWRKYQAETVSWVHEHTGPLIVEMPTGSGKSAVACSLAKDGRTLILTRKVNLQDQYGEQYDAHLIKGASNYPCLINNKMTAEDCMDDECVQSSDCPYFVARREAMHRELVCTNYTFWLAYRPIRETLTDGNLVCDEAHLLSEIVLDWVGIRIRERTVEEYNLPPLPSFRQRTASAFEQFNGSVTRLPTEELIDWLTSAHKALSARWKSLIALGADQDEIRRVHGLKMKIASTHDAILENAADWFLDISFDPESGNVLTARPLTAKYHFPGMFLRARRVMMMSATIGNVETFAEELGIERFDNLVVPNQYPPERRPVYILDTPPLSHSSCESEYNKQADEIARAVLSLPRNWSGLIHVTRKSEAVNLARRLSARGLGNRIWIPPTMIAGRLAKTSQQIEEWEKRKRSVPGSIMIAWQFWEGFDGREEKICIVAKTPFPFLGDRYEVARMKYSGAFYRQRTAWTLMQALGRTRRGNEEDYDCDGEQRGFVAIADGNWKQVRKYISADVLESMREL